MQAIPDDHTGNGRLRFIFDDAVVSFGLAANATFEDIARTLGELSNQRYGNPVAIDVILAVPSGSFCSPHIVPTKFCSDAEYEGFLTTARVFEHLPSHCGVRPVNTNLTSPSESRKRGSPPGQRIRSGSGRPARPTAPPLRNDEYTIARDVMLERAHNLVASWAVVRATTSRRRGSA